jgi:hypothetical protein
MSKKESNWPERDELPMEDPIGDTNYKHIDPNHYTKDALRYMTAHQAGLRNEDETNEWVSGYKKWQADQEAYQKQMKPSLIHPEGKDFIGIEHPPIVKCFMNHPIDFVIRPIKITIVEKHKHTCTCGTHAVHGKVPVHAHATHCDLRRDD